MPLESRFLYKLGHARELSLAELGVFDAKIEKTSKFWAVSKTDLNINKTGSISVKAEIIREFDNQEPSKNRLMDALEAFLLSNKRKKVGLLIPGVNKNELINLAKKTGSKKVNAKTSGDLNYGHWKQVKSWIITIEFGAKIILAEVLDMFDQEFFSVLDSFLPEKDMARGMINLKLARTLLNFTNSPFIWDPFAGVGRIPVAGADLKKDFFASDIDAVCLPQIQKNYDSGFGIWRGNKRFKFQKNSEEKFAKMVSVFQHDATDFSQDFKSEDGLAVVTEGYLGKNFKKAPSMQEAQEELEKVELMWQKSLNCFQKYGVKEVVFTLPFYEWKDRELHPDLDLVLKNSDYKLINLLPDLDFISYRRKDSFTGHAVVKVILTSK